MAVQYRWTNGEIKYEMIDAWNMRNLFKKFIRFIRKWLVLFKQDKEEASDFSLFNRQRLMLSTRELESEYTQIMIGAAIQKKYVSIPESVFKVDDDDKSSKYFMVY